MRIGREEEKNAIKNTESFFGYLPYWFVLKCKKNTERGERILGVICLGHLDSTPKNALYKLLQETGDASDNENRERRGKML
jgi:hypothetical protein